MRMYRLCEYKGRLNLGSYLALRDTISIGEALELEAAGLVIADHTAEFADFYSEYVQGGSKPTTNTPAGPAKRTKKDMREEIEHREKRLVKARGALNHHRAAIAYCASGQEEPPGRLDARSLRHTEVQIRSHGEVIAYLTKQLGATDGE